MKRGLWFIGILSALTVLGAVPTLVSASHVGDSADFVTTIALTQTNPGTPVHSLSFVDTNGDGLPDDLNSNGTPGEPGLVPAGDQTMRIDRPGQVFEGTIDEVTALTEKGKKVAKQVTGANLTITFNSTIFVGPAIAPGVHAIFGAASGEVLITRQDHNEDAHEEDAHEKEAERESLTIGFRAALEGTLNTQGTLDPGDDTVVVSDTGHFKVIEARGGLNSLKELKGDLSAQATGPIGAESAVVKLSGLVK